MKEIESEINIVEEKKEKRETHEHKIRFRERGTDQEDITAAAVTVAGGNSTLRR
jgi:hypothetical protein